MRNHSIVAAGIAVLVTLAAVARPCHSTDPVEDPGSADDMLAKLGTARGMNGSAIIFREAVAAMYSKATKEVFRLPVGRNPQRSQHTYAQLDAYAADHAKRLNAPSRELAKDKFLLFRPVNVGAGNKVQGLVGSFLLAVMTNRIFICDYADAVRLFDAPIAWEYTDALKELLEPTDAQLAARQKKLKKKSKRSRARSGPAALSFEETRPSGSRSGAKGDGAGPPEFWVCDDLKERFTTNVLLVHGNRWFGSELLYNGPHHDDIVALFGGDIVPEEEDYSLLHNWLLRPKPALWGRVQAFKRAFFSDTLTIGVQMRRTERWTYSWHEPTFFEAAEAMIPPGVDPASVRFFIATENATSRVNAIQALGPDRVIFNPAVLRTQGMRGMGRTSQLDAFMDHLLLSETDDMLVTCGSSYGMISYSDAQCTQSVNTLGPFTMDTCVRRVSHYDACGESDNRDRPTAPWITNYLDVADCATANAANVWQQQQWPSYTSCLPLNHVPLPLVLTYSLIDSSYRCPNVEPTPALPDSQLPCTTVPFVRRDNYVADDTCSRQSVATDEFMHLQCVTSYVRLSYADATDLITEQWFEDDECSVPIGHTREYREGRCNDALVPGASANEGVEWEWRSQQGTLRGSRYVGTSGRCRSAELANSIGEFANGTCTPMHWRYTVDGCSPSSSTASGLGARAWLGGASCPEGAAGDATSGDDAVGLWTVQSWSDGQCDELADRDAPLHWRFSFTERWDTVQQCATPCTVVPTPAECVQFSLRAGTCDSQPIDGSEFVQRVGECQTNNTFIRFTLDDETAGTVTERWFSDATCETSVVFQFSHTSGECEQPWVESLVARSQLYELTNRNKKLRITSHSNRKCGDGNRQLSETKVTLGECLARTQLVLQERSPLGAVTTVTQYEWLGLADATSCDANEATPTWWQHASYDNGQCYLIERGLPTSDLSQRFDAPADCPVEPTPEPTVAPTASPSPPPPTPAPTAAPTPEPTPVPLMLVTTMRVASSSSSATAAAACTGDAVIESSVLNDTCTASSVMLRLSSDGTAVEEHYFVDTACTTTADEPLVYSWPAGECAPALHTSMDGYASRRYRLRSKDTEADLRTYVDDACAGDEFSRPGRFVLGECIDAHELTFASGDADEVFNSRRWWGTPADAATPCDVNETAAVFFTQRIDTSAAGCVELSRVPTFVDANTTAAALVFDMATPEPTPAPTPAPRPNVVQSSSWSRTSNSCPERAELNQRRVPEGVCHLAAPGDDRPPVIASCHPNGLSGRWVEYNGTDCDSPVLKVIEFSNCACRVEEHSGTDDPEEITTSQFTCCAQEPDDTDPTGFRDLCRCAAAALQPSAYVAVAVAVAVALLSLLSTEMTR